MQHSVSTFAARPLGSTCVCVCVAWDVSWERWIKGEEHLEFTYLFSCSLPNSFPCLLSMAIKFLTTYQLLVLCELEFLCASCGPACVVGVYNIVCRNGMSYVSMQYGIEENPPSFFLPFLHSCPRYPFPLSFFTYVQRCIVLNIQRR